MTKPNQIPMGLYISHEYGFAINPDDCQECAADTCDTCDILAGQEWAKDITLLRVIRNIFNSQGFYSALAFMLNCGLVPGRDQELAEGILNRIVGGNNGKEK